MTTSRLQGAAEMGRARALYVRQPKAHRPRPRKPVCRKCGRPVFVNFRTGKTYLECATCRGKAGA